MSDEASGPTVVAEALEAEGTEAGGTRSVGVEVACFFLLALGLSIPGLLFWDLPLSLAPVSLETAMSTYRKVAFLIVWTPMEAALITAFLFRRRAGVKELLSSVARWRVAPRWYLAAILAPVVPHALSVIWAAWRGEPLLLPDPTEALVTWLIVTVILGSLLIGEELGWRGFLLPRLQSRYSALMASAIVGALWALWHYPIWLLTNYAVTASWLDSWRSIGLSTIAVLGISVLFSWVFNGSGGSVLLAMLMHGSNNAALRLATDMRPGSFETEPPYALASLLCAAAVVAIFGARQLGRRPRVTR